MYFARTQIAAAVTAAVVAGPVLGQIHEPDPDARRVFRELVDAYRKRPALTVRSTVTIELIQGETKSHAREVVLEITFGRGRVGIVKLRGFTCHLADGKLTAIHEGSEDAYYSVSDDDSPYYALMSEFMEVPFPHLAIAFGEERTDDLLMQFHQMAPWIQPTGVGQTVKDDRTLRTISLTSDFSDLSILVDPKSKLMDSVVLNITGGSFVQPGATLRYRHAFEYESHDEALDAAKLVFELGDRQRADSLMALMPAPPEPEMPELGPDGHPQGGLVGTPAPDLELATADGDVMDLEALRGKVVVLDFWATWCVPCRAALPVLHEVAEWFFNDTATTEIYTVNIWEQGGAEERLAAAQRFWAADGFTLPVAMDYNDRSAALFGITGIPLTIVIAPDGVIHAQHVGVQGYKATIERAIVEALGVE
jgi:thiol-disulfide isomerase/thioredoxin